MRQGPDYINRVEEDDCGLLCCYVPLELVNDFDGVDFVKWHENDDGSYTLTLFDYVV
jgi:hypothetical protein